MTRILFVGLILKEKRHGASRGVTQIFKIILVQAGSTIKRCFMVRQVGIRYIGDLLPAVGSVIGWKNHIKNTTKLIRKRSQTIKLSNGSGNKRLSETRRISAQHPILYCICGYKHESKSGASIEAFKTGFQIGGGKETLTVYKQLIDTLSCIVCL